MIKKNIDPLDSYYTVESESAKVTTEVKKSYKAVKILVALLIILLVAFGWAYFNYRSSSRRVAQLSSAVGQKELIKKETTDLVNRVRKHLMLPTDEEPTVATILDVATLVKSQPFYKNAENGDKVLVYVKAQKAIIYNPTKDILVNVGPVYIENQQNAVTAKVQPTSLEIRNGSKQTGIAKQLEIELAADKQYVATYKSAANNNYSGNLIVNLKNKDVAALVKKLNAKVMSALPAAEATSTVDVVIILGN